jgi:hypothetical protein
MLKDALWLGMFVFLIVVVENVWANAQEMIPKVPK